MRFKLFISLCLLYTQVLGQFDFNGAYQSNPFVPRGVLEAVAWTNTRMTHLNTTEPSCSGIPSAFGIMGLHDDGADYFIENGFLVAQLSGISVPTQKAVPNAQIMAYAIAFNSLMMQRAASPGEAKNPKHIRAVLNKLTELPDSGMVNLLARDMQVYEVLRFMVSSQRGSEFNFTPFHFDLPDVFGIANYGVLSASKIVFTNGGITNEHNDIYVSNQAKSNDYGPAIWNPAPSCNFSSRNGVAVSAITIHTVQGTYAGAISWAQNCAAGVSYHYVIRSSDGQITQMVQESDKGWHVGSENPYTIGYEHEGYVDNPAWYTEAMYTSSAGLSKDIVNSGYGIPALRTYYGAASAVVNVLGACTKIKGHQHYPNQSHTDPGINWNWEKYYRLINDNPAITLVNTPSGNFYDSGGQAGSYDDDERLIWLFQPPNVQQITLSFSAFSVESGYDQLFIYDGDNLDAPLLGVYTGVNSPGTISSSGGALLVEFRSDCGTVSTGWEASMTSVPIDNTPPTTTILSNGTWQTQDFQIDFDDFDTESGVAEKYYVLARKNTSMNDWQSDPQLGFAFETFENNVSNWSVQTGVFGLNSGTYSMTDNLQENSNAFLTIPQDANSDYLFTWKQTINGAGANQRAGLHFFCDDATLPNRGNSYFIYLRESDDKAQIYRVANDIFSLMANVDFVVNAGQTYACKTTYEPISGWIRVYIDDELVVEWQDPNPHLSGNAISLRSGGCTVSFDDIHVYKSRGGSVIVTTNVGNHFAFESDAAIPSGIAATYVKDNEDNWSAFASDSFLLDFSAPTFDYLNDGIATDIDTFTIASIQGNWNATDLQSDIAFFEYAIGIVPSPDNVTPWTAIGNQTSIDEILNLPQVDQVYLLSVRATNNAGLVSAINSDGQRYVTDASLSESDLIQLTLYPNPASDELMLNNLIGAAEYLIYDSSGKLCLKGTTEGTISLRTLAEGNYKLIVRKNNLFIAKSFIIKRL